MPIATNVRDDRSVHAGLRNAQVVFNLIGILYESGSWSFEQAHVETAERIGRCCAESGSVQRLVHVSAMGIERAAGDSRYAASKLAGEQAVCSTFPQVTIARPNLIFGAEDRFFNLFAWITSLSPALPLLGGGRTRFQPVYVDDVAQALTRCMDDPASRARVYELAGPEVYSFRSLMELMLNQTGRSRLLVNISWRQARLLARVLELFPAPLLTRDQVTLLGYDNIASGMHPSLAELGVTPTSLELILPTYLARFRRGGRTARVTTPSP